MHIPRLALTATVSLALIGPLTPAAAVPTVTPGASLLGTSVSVASAPFRAASSSAKKYQAQVQAFAYDGATLYTVQLATATSDDVSAQRGDLRIVRQSSGQASMVLKSFGHGVTLAIEPNAANKDRPWLWIETASTKKDGVGFGTKIARVQFRSGATYTYKGGKILAGKKQAPEATVVKSLTRSDAIRESVSIDPTSDQLALRYQSSNSSWHYETYLLSAVKTTCLTKLPSCLDPFTLGDWTMKATEGDSKHYFQGWALFQGRIYTMQTPKKKSEKDVVDQPSATISSFAVNSAAYTSVTLLASKTAGAGKYAFSDIATKNYPHGEPEGLAIYLAGGTPRLHWGLAGKPGKIAKLKIFSLK